MIIIVWGLKNKFQIAGCLDEPVHVLEQSLRGYTGIYLGGLDNTFAGTTIIIIFAPT